MQNSKMNTKKVKAGRWTLSQHNRFIDALQRYGRNWEKVCKKVKTRSIDQIRSHAQKFFLSMSNSDVRSYIGDSHDSLEEEISKNKKNVLKDCDELEKFQTKKQKKKRRQSMSSCCSSNKTSQLEVKTASKNVQDNQQISLMKPTSQIVIPQPINGSSHNVEVDDAMDHESMFIKLMKSHEQIFRLGGNFMDLIQNY